MRADAIREVSSGLPRLQIRELHLAYRTGRSKPTEVARTCAERAREPESEGVFITRRPLEPLIQRARELEEYARELGDDVFAVFPLFGVPYVVKDNIETAGLPVTCACPESVYIPDAHAFVVQRLHEAGALLVGKTNMDQFATGLTGVRTPYGIPRNPFDPSFVPGGSSSGSAVAVARGYGVFALGTDTAGSGRVPAAFNDLVGYKPTRGRLSTRGVVPACRSLDCVSVFANTIEDAKAVADVAGAYDVDDPFARPTPGSLSNSLGESFRFGVLPEDEPFEDDSMRHLYEFACERLRTAGGRAVRIDFRPFRRAAAMLYEGPFLAERAASIASWLEERPEAMHPVVRTIVAPGLSMRAIDVYRGFHELAAIRRETERTWAEVDVLCLPTTPTIERIDDVLADPIERNRRLGRYTNFVNLLDLSALALPAGFRPDGLPLGITLIGRAWDDELLFHLGSRYEEAMRTRG